MTAFLDALTNVGMIPYHLLLVMVLLYWTIGLIGVLDIDILDSFLPDFDFGDGGADGALDGVDGIDGGDVDVGGDVGDVGVLAKGLDALSVGTVPMTIILSFLILKMWLLAMINYMLVVPRFGVGFPAWLVAIVSFVAIFVISIYATSMSVRPLRKMFKFVTIHGGAHLVGKICTIKTPSVSTKSGQAEVALEGGPLLLIVRGKEENKLGKGDEAVIVGYDEAANVYDVRAL